MRNIPGLVVIIIAIVALIIIVGFIIGTITHKIKDDVEKDLPSEKSAQVDSSQSDFIPVYEEFFAIQLFATGDYSKIEHLSKKLIKNGYETKISKVKREGKLIYRLRLDGIYKENEANTLGEKLKKEFPSIKNFWLEEIQTDFRLPGKESIATTEEKTIQEIPQEEYVQETKKQIPEYESQLLASETYSEVEKVKNNLEKLGYKTKILTFTQNKKIVYRLRLRGLYQKEEGIIIAKKIKKDSPQINSFWLDEIKDGKSVPHTTPIAETSKKKETIKDTGKKDFEIQLLANKNISVVEKKKQKLEKLGYLTKITSVVKNGVTYYRLRLSSSYTKSEARRVGDNLKRKVSFVNDYWIVKKGTGKSYSYKPTKKSDKSLTEPIVTSMNPKYAPNRVEYTLTCKQDNVHIRIGPGTYYAIDPIGKLMKGVTIFVIEEKKGWIRFTIVPEDESWSGWVKKSLVE